MKAATRKLHVLGIATAMSVLAAGAATAAQMKAAEPQPGTCKRAYEAVVGPSGASAQAMWTQMVAAKFGTKWAHWVGAQNKAIVPVASGSGTQFQARAQPCFHQPVL